jgi:hypothetical protein
MEAHRLTASPGPAAGSSLGGNFGQGSTPIQLSNPQQVQQLQRLVAGLVGNPWWYSDGI